MGSILTFLVLVAAVPKALSKLVTVTMDDTIDQNAGSGALSYTNCTAQSAANCGIACSFIDASATFLSTWHDCSYGSVQLTFNGTEFHMYEINYVVPGYRVSTYLDKQLVAISTVTRTNSTNLEYNRLAWGTNVTAGQHNATIVAADGVFLFDYATYTYDDGEPTAVSSEAASPSQTYVSSASASTHTSAGSIVGAVVGSLVGILLISSIVLVLAHRRRRRLQSANTRENARRWTSFVDSKSHVSAGAAALSSPRFSEFVAKPAMPRTDVHGA